MLSLRKKIFIISGVVVGLILALLLLYFYVLKPRVLQKETPQETQKNDTQQINNQVKIPTGTTGIFQKPKDPDELYAKQIAKIFVERFATYSNQNDNSHIDSVLTLSTDVMSKWLETQKLTQGTEYQGSTTRVISSSVENFTSDKAVVSIGVQQELSSAGETKRIQKTGKVELLKVDSEWKVDGLYWDK